MSLAATLAALLAMQLPAGTLRLDCGLADAGQDASAGTTRLMVTLEVGARGIQSADIDGPPLFSSRQGLQFFDATPRRGGGMNVSRSEPNRNALRWTPRLADGKIGLTRQNSRIDLEPDAAAEGNWRGTYDLGMIRMGHMMTEGPAGAIACRRAAS